VRITKRTVQSGKLGDVYVAIEKWIQDQGLEVGAAPRETFWTDFYSAAEDDEVFDVAFPISLCLQSVTPSSRTTAARQRSTSSPHELAALRWIVSTAVSMSDVGEGEAVRGPVVRSLPSSGGVAVPVEHARHPPNATTRGHRGCA
jgi:hypothetical protein